MHLLNARAATLEDAGEAVDLGQTPGDIVVLSAADTELACLAAAQARPAGGRARACASPTCCSSAIRCRSISMSSRSSRSARLVVVRLLGGRGYWPYGVEQVAAACRARGDPARAAAGRRPAGPGARRLSTLAAGSLPSPVAVSASTAASTTPAEFLRLRRQPVGRDEPWQEPAPLLRAGLYWPGMAPPDARRSRARAGGQRSAGGGAGVLPRPGPGGRPRAVDALIEALDARRAERAADLRREPQGPGRGAAGRSELLAEAPPDVILNATGFASRARAQRRADAARRARTARCCRSCFAGGSEAAWRDGTRGLSPRDIAMNVALPEIDGRILSAPSRSRAGAGAIRAPRPTSSASRRSPTGSLRGRARGRLGAARGARRAAERRVALVLANYPNRDGRIGNGVGLDTPASTVAPAARRWRAPAIGSTACRPTARRLIEALLAGVDQPARRPRRPRGSGCRFPLDRLPQHSSTN